ncbi:unnamed protein product [Anisakis simplex]|uniref:Uncharacterized protein n=1 Tax=Anisakis simplex TaxID=6269 RepID=A0A0M3JCW0_ANISI|nr:unnamed protein product [Anisakis simplex]
MICKNIFCREELPSTVFFLPRGGSTSTRSIGLLALPVNDRSMRIVAMTERQLSGGIGLLAPYHHHPSSHSSSAVCDHKTSSKQTAESVVVLCCPTAASVCYSSILPTVLKLAPVSFEKKCVESFMFPFRFVSNLVDREDVVNVAQWLVRVVVEKRDAGSMQAKDIKLIE